MAIFERIGKQLTDAGQSAAQQTRNFTDVARLNSAISEREKKISQLYSLIGKSYYEKHKFDSGAEESECIGEINSLFYEIAQNREKIRQIKGVMTCEKCGAEVSVNSSFCSVCGASINHADAVREEAGAGRRCPNCNAVVEEGNLFCIHCGAKVDGTGEGTNE